MIKESVAKVFRRDVILRILGYIALSCVIVFFVFYILYKFYFDGQIEQDEITFFISSIKDIFQVLFFILIGVVTILSYVQAKKTLFTPIKTETFKMQIKAFEDILSFFQTKTETDFTELFDFDFIVKGNFQFLVHAYVRTFFSDEIELDDEKVKELKNKFCGGIMTKSYVKKNIEKIEYFEKRKPEAPQKITNPAIILENWRAFEYGHISFTKKYSDAVDKLNQIIASPLLPNELKLKLEAFESQVGDNLVAVGTVLTNISKELPHKFPTAESLQNLEISGIWNEYNSEKKAFQPPAEEILRYIRQYLRIDELIE